MAYGRTEEQQALADANARAETLRREVKMLKAALDNRDLDIKKLKSKDSSEITMRDYFAGQFATGYYVHSETLLTPHIARMIWKDVDTLLAERNAPADAEDAK